MERKMAEKYFVTTADSSMIGQLKALWKNVFGDTDEYISLFFEKRFTPSQCVAAISGGKVVGMLFLLPFDLVCGNERYSGRYIYAVATHPDHRRQGISEAMLSFAGIGVAMGNACEELKQVADYVTLSVDDDGVSHALKKFGLID